MCFGDTHFNRVISKPSPIICKHCCTGVTFAAITSIVP